MGKELGDKSFINFYGTSFITDPTGAIVTDASKGLVDNWCEEDEDNVVLTATFDLDKITACRASWGLFRDRRPQLYRPLLTLDGHTDLI